MLVFFLINNFLYKDKEVSLKNTKKAGTIINILEIADNLIASSIEIKVCIP